MTPEGSHHARVEFMNPPAAKASPAEIRASSGRACPCCKGPVYRVPRRFVDLLISRFMPLRRYRCWSIDCGWEGNLREKRHSLTGAGHGDAR